MFALIVRNVTAALSNVTILPSKPAVLFIFAILLYFAASKALFSSLPTSFLNTLTIGNDLKYLYKLSQTF